MTLHYTRANKLGHSSPLKRIGLSQSTKSLKQSTISNLHIRSWWTMISKNNIVFQWVSKRWLRMSKKSQLLKTWKRNHSRKAMNCWLKYRTKKSMSNLWPGASSRSILLSKGSLCISLGMTTHRLNHQWRSCRIIYRKEKSMSSWRMIKNSHWSISLLMRNRRTNPQTI